MAINSSKRNKIVWKFYHVWEMLIYIFDENFKCLRLCDVVITAKCQKLVEKLIRWFIGENKIKF